MFPHKTVIPTTDMCYTINASQFRSFWISTHLDSDSQVISDGNGGVGSQTRELGRVDVEEVASFSRELDSASTVGATSLDEEGVVVLD